MQMTEKETARLINELSKKEELTHLCLSEIGVGPLDGACYATAKALQENIGGELYTMWGTSHGSELHQDQHVLVKTGEFYWDGEGRHTEPELRERWTKQELLSGIELKAFQETDVPDSPRDSRFAADLSHFFNEVMATNPEEKAERRSIVNLHAKTPELDVNPMNAIAHLLKTEQWKALSPDQINNGNCDMFADDLHELVGGEVWATPLNGELPIHSFLKWRDRYYDAQTPLGVQNWKHLPMFRPDVGIRNDHIDFHSGQNDYELLAEFEGTTVGKFVYSEYNGVPKVTDIYVTREARRQGIATELAMKLQELYPDTAVEWDYFVTQAGVDFYDALPKKSVPIPEVIKGRQQLEGVKTRLAEYADKEEVLFSKGQPTPEELEAHHQETADWNDLHELHDELAHYANEPTHKTMIEVPAILDYECPEPEITPSP